MIRAKASLERQNSFATHYVACWTQDNCQIRCWHQHKILSEAVSCLQSPGGFIRAVTDGRERSLTNEEQEGLVRLLLELYLREKEVSRLDSKTSALNDRAFRQALSDESRRSRRHRTPITVVYLDLDGFKKVNDDVGHAIGDLILKVVVWTMQSTLREVDFVARLGGDEFALLLPETSAESAGLVIEKLRKSLKDAMTQYKWNITFSMGVVTFRTPPGTPDYMIDLADKAMLSVKRMGKDRVSRLVLD